MIEKDDRLLDEGIKENLTSTPILGRSEKFLNRRTINNERNGLTKRYSLENTNFETPPRTNDLKMTYTNQESPWTFNLEFKFSIGGLCSWMWKFYSPEHVTHRRLVRPQFRDDRPEILAAQNRTQNRMTESQALHILQKHHNKIKDDNKNLKHENAKIKVSALRGVLSLDVFRQGFP